MQIEAKKLIGLPVAAIDSGSRVGEIQKIIIDHEKGTVLGFLVKTNGLLGAHLVLSTIDISDWDPNAVVTASIDNLVPPKEIVRIERVLKNKFELLGLSARTESLKNLGRVENFLIDTETSAISKYYLKDLISGERIFSSDKVVRIESKVIVFSDDVEVVPPDAASVTA